MQLETNEDVMISCHANQKFSLESKNGYIDSSYVDRLNVT